MTRRSRWLVAFAVGIGGLGIAAWAQLARPTGPKTYGFKVVTAYPHDPMAFTQGLVIRDGKLYEGTGEYGASSIRRVDLATGRVDKLHSLPSQYFGEGVTVLGGKLYELTWKSGLGFVYDASTFNLEKTFQYKGEGWGLTDDGKQLIMSDGSAKLRFIDPATLTTVREVTVLDGDKPIDRLNELEYIDGEVWSNVWYEDRIARIAPATGKVVGWVDLSQLYPASARPSEAVLNGIAYDAAAKKLYVTGKDWPQIYEIEVVGR